MYYSDDIFISERKYLSYSGFHTSTSTPSQSPHPTNLENIFQNLGFYRLYKDQFYFCWARYISEKQPRALIFFSYLTSIALLCKICKGKKYRVIRIHCIVTNCSQYILVATDGCSNAWMTFSRFGLHMMCICWNKIYLSRDFHNTDQIDHPVASITILEDR